MSEAQQRFLVEYFDKLKTLIDAAPVVNDLIAVAKLFRRCGRRGGQVLIVGNGGSAAIAGHIAIDLTKNAGINARVLSSDAEITCLANDYGYEHWLEHAIRLRFSERDCLVAISSSGNSPNIVNGVKYGKSRGMQIVTLSGMSPDNELRQLGEINLWIDSSAYNLIETIHQFWLMSILDLIIGRTEYSANRVVPPNAQVKRGISDS